MERGLLLVFTGNAEDNAISAVGQVLRALGAGLKICVFHFRRESGRYGELAHLQRLFNMLETHGINDNGEATQPEPGDLWRKAVDVLNHGEVGMLVLLELAYLVDNKIVEEREIVDAIRNRAASLHVIVAGGRGLDPLIQEADLVTEVNEVKNLLRRDCAGEGDPSASGFLEPA